MPARTTAYVTPEMLQWAREQAACSLEDASKIVKQALQVVESWESPGSDARPTVRQAQKLANAYGIPFALLYLGQPYTDLEPDPVPEFRGLDPGSGQGLTHGSCAGWCARLKSGRLLPSSCWNWQQALQCG